MKMVASGGRYMFFEVCKKKKKKVRILKRVVISSHRLVFVLRARGKEVCNITFINDHFYRPRRSLNCFLSFYRHFAISF